MFYNILIITGYLLADLILVSSGHALDTRCLARVCSGVCSCLSFIRVWGFGVYGVWSRRVREKRGVLGADTSHRRGLNLIEFDNALSYPVSLSCPHNFIHPALDLLNRESFTLNFKVALKLSYISFNSFSSDEKIE